MPELLVERRALSRARRPSPGLSLARRFPRRGNRRTPRQARRSLSPLSLPPHHELRAGVPQAPQSRQGHRRNQKIAGRQAGLAVDDPPAAIGKLTRGAFDDLRLAADPHRVPEVAAEIIARVVEGAHHDETAAMAGARIGPHLDTGLDAPLL